MLGTLPCGTLDAIRNMVSAGIHVPVLVFILLSVEGAVLQPSRVLLDNRLLRRSSTDGFWACGYFWLATVTSAAPCSGSRCGCMALGKSVFWWRADVTSRGYLLDDCCQHCGRLQPHDRPHGSNRCGLDALALWQQDSKDRTLNP